MTPEAQTWQRTPDLADAPQNAFRQIFGEICSLLLVILQGGGSDLCLHGFFSDVFAEA
jgi:hypothetical protein